MKKFRAIYWFWLYNILSLLNFVLETTFAIEKVSCGNLILKENGSYLNINGFSIETKPGVRFSLDILLETGSNNELCWSNISDAYPQLNHLQLSRIEFQPSGNYCELHICGTFQNSNTGDCYTLAGNGHAEFHGNALHISSLMCGCEVQTSGSNTNSNLLGNQCEKNLFDDSNGTVPCGSLFFEPNCTSRMFFPKHLNENEMFESCHESSVKSLFAYPGYKIIRTHKEQEIEYVGGTSFNYGSKSLYGSSGDKFTCQKIKPQKNLIFSTGLTILLIVLGLIGFMIVLIGGIYVLKKSESKELGINGELYNAESNQSQLFDPKWELRRADLKLDLDDPSKLLGTGTFGKVIQGKLLRKNADGSQELVEVAVKTFHALDAVVNMSHIKALINEIRMMSIAGSHPNIVRFFGSHIDLRRGNIFCVMELCSKGSLLGHLSSLRSSAASYSSQLSSKSSKTYCTNANVRGRNTAQSDGEVEEIDNKPNETNSSYEEIPTNTNTEEIRQTDQTENHTPDVNIVPQMIQWSWEIANGMSFLQQNNILHIDLAARNILLDSDLKAKISDFGLSRKLYTKFDKRTGNDSTQKIYKKSPGLDLLPYKHIALESLLLGSYSSKSDVWSYGVTLWEIFSCGLEPYCNILEPSVLQLFLQSGKRLSTPEYATDEIYCQMLSCWIDEPHLRPDFENLSAFFQSLQKSHPVLPVLNSS